MTDEEQKRLVADLRATGFQCFHRAAEEIERLQRELNSTLGLLYQESEHRALQDKRLERLEKDVEALRRM